jgi:hypothetical protein
VEIEKLRKIINKIRNNQIELDDFERLQEGIKDNARSLFEISENIRELEDNIINAIDVSNDSES